MLRRYSAQSSFLKYEDFHPGNTNHYIGTEVTLKGDLVIHALQQAFAKVVQRHDMLRSGLSRNSDGSYFNVNHNSQQNAPIKIIDVSNQQLTCTCFKDMLAAINQSSYLTEPFDLEKGPLWRAVLIKTASNEYKLSLLCHPLIADDRSISILLNEIQSYYNQNVLGQNLALPMPKPSASIVEFDDAARKQYWRNKLKNLNVIKPHTPKSYTGVMRFRGKHKQMTLDSDLVTKLKTSFPDFTMEQILLTSLYTLMSRYTGETDITLGTTDANRPLSDHEINACANWLTLRMQFGSNDKFVDLLQQTAAVRTEAFKYQLPIDDLYKTILTDGERAALQTTAAFDVLLNFNNNDVPKISLHNVEASAVKHIDLGHNSSALFKLNLNQVADGSCEGFINYNTDLFDDATIDRLLGHLQNILQTAAEQPDCKIHDIPMLLESEVRLISEFNNTNITPAYGDQMTPDIFSTIAGQNSAHPALVFHPRNAAPQRMSYLELEKLSNQYANYFRETCRLKKGDHIALSITRSTNLVAATLGAIKAGLVFVPLETSPGSLFEYKFNNAEAALVVTDSHTNELFKDKNIPVINIDDASTSYRIKNFDDTYYPPGVTPASPVYLMYSSGTSTGIPKASLLTHAGLANLFNALHAQHYPESLQILCTALPTFDAFLFDFLAVWSRNGTVHLSSDEERYSLEAVERIIRKEKINFAVFLPDIMSLLPTDLPLEYTISMGAAAREGTFDRWIAANPNRKIINGMGHTETGICLSLQEYHPGDDPDLIGTPISNMKEFILDPVHHTLCPIGVPGELFVAGPGLASEYVGNPELTKKHYLTMKFDAAQNKFTPCDAHEPGAVRLYASGDFCCYQLTKDGKLSTKSIGRTDGRCKLFGVSVDPNGVEAMLNKDPLVQAVTVTPNKDFTGLIAYVVRNEKFDHILPNDAKALLRARLRDTPLHPIAYPKYIRFLTELPKTANGKIDVKKLVPPPEHELRKPFMNQDITHILMTMWRDVIASDAIEDSDTKVSFADLGGNSLALCQLEIKINSELPLTRRIGQNLLCMEMTINSLADAIKPYLKTSNAIAKTTSISTATINKYKKNHTSLFSNKPQYKIMNSNNTSSNIKPLSNT